jgi:hypothetical protein
MADIVGSGRAVAPLAAAVLAQIAAGALPKGRYDIEVKAMVSNAAAADLDNMQLLKNGVALVNPLPTGANGAHERNVYKGEEIDGVNPIQVVVVANGTAAIVYEATIDATPVG